MNASKRLRRSPVTLACLASLLLGAALPAAAATFTVNSTADAPDADVGDGVCADAQGLCTLRAAIMQANALGGDNVIDLRQISDPNNPIVLTIPGADETATGNAADGFQVVETHDASKGDLNITSSMEIIGAGADKTIIEWAPEARQTPESGDRVFHIEALSSNIAVSISGVTIENGVTPAPQKLQDLPGGTFYQLERSGAGIAIGTAAAVTYVNPASSGSKEGGGGGGSAGGNGGSGSGGSGSDEGGGPGSGGEEEGGESAATITGVVLNDVRILNNQSGAAGGGISSAAPLTLDNVLVSGNTAATNGGGIYNDAQLTVVNSTIGAMSGFPNGNSAEGGGGLFDTGMHATTIEESAIDGNKAVGGGGISARSMVTLSIVNTTINGNTATDVGGAMTGNGAVTLRNDTISDNTVGEKGGAGLNAFANGTYQYVNTLFQGNVFTASPGSGSCGCSGSSCKTGAFLSLGHNLSDDGTCSLTGAGDLANTAAGLQPLGANGGRTESRALLSGSPAVDAGDNANCPNTDQRGSLRPADGNLRNTEVCDIGAFELFIPRADLHVSGKGGPDRMPRGAATNATFEFTNGSSTSTDATGVVVSTDPLPAAFTFSGASMSTSSGSSACAFDENTRVVSCAVGTLPAGQSVTVTVNGSGNARGALSITAHIAAAAPADLFPDNNSTTVTMQMLGLSNVGVAASTPSQAPKVNGQAGLTFSVKNFGPDDAGNVRVLAIFQSRMAYQSMQVSSGGSCTPLPDGMSALCELGTIAAGDTVTGTLTLVPGSVGTTDVEFQVATDDVDSDGSNDSAVVPITINAESPPTTPTSPSAPSSSSSGGGCAYRPGGSLDPTLLAMLAVSGLGLLARGRKRGGGSR